MCFGPLIAKELFRRARDSGADELTPGGVLDARLEDVLLRLEAERKIQIPRGDLHVAGDLWDSLPASPITDLWQLDAGSGGPLKARQPARFRFEFVNSKASRSLALRACRGEDLGGWRRGTGHRTGLDFDPVGRWSVSSPRSRGRMSPKRRTAPAGHGRERGRSRAGAVESGRDTDRGTGHAAQREFVP